MPALVLTVTSTTVYTVPAYTALLLKGAMVRPSTGDETASRYAFLTLNGAPVASWDFRVAGGGLTAPARATSIQDARLDLTFEAGQVVTLQLNGNGAAVTGGVWGDLVASGSPDPPASSTVAGLDANAALTLIQSGDLLLNWAILVASVLLLWRFLR